jgi:hypothetical protein
MRFWLSGPRFLGIRPGISFALSELTRRRPSPRRLQSRQLSGSFIYIVQADDGLVKVGISGNPNARLAQLQRASTAHLTWDVLSRCRLLPHGVDSFILISIS